MTRLIYLTLPEGGGGCGWPGGGWGWPGGGCTGGFAFMGAGVIRGGGVTVFVSPKKH